MKTYIITALIILTIALGLKQLQATGKSFTQDTVAQLQISN
jgi:Tfp pilus assembly protein PilV